MTTSQTVLVVFLSMWSETRLWFFNQGKKIIPKSLDEARDFADKHGYGGIKVRPVG